MVPSEPLFHASVPFSTMSLCEGKDSKKGWEQRFSGLVFVVFLPLKDKSIDIGLQYLCFYNLISMLLLPDIYAFTRQYPCFCNAFPMLLPCETHTFSLQKLCLYIAANSIQLTHSKLASKP